VIFLGNIFSLVIVATTQYVTVFDDLLWNIAITW